MPKVKTKNVSADDLYFSSDLHICHNSLMKMRGFVTKEEMHERIVTNWNNTVPINGIVFVLGDISFGNTADTIAVLGQLNGQKHLIRGNHDKGLSVEVLNEFLSDNIHLEIDVVEAPSIKQRISLMHYAMRVWNRHHYGAWHLYGHSHGNLPGYGKSMDVGLDANNLTPFKYEEIKELLLQKEIQAVDHHVLRDERHYDIYIESYRMSGDIHVLGKVKASSFREACRKLAEQEGLLNVFNEEQLVLDGKRLSEQK